MSTVSWTLEDAAGGTRLILVHEGLDEVGSEAALGLLMALEEGWDKHFVKLRAAVAG